MTPTTTIDIVRPRRFRHEIKIPLNTADELLLRSQLERAFPHDKHADSHGEYRVSSLYFDTPNDLALREKMYGLPIRDKYRIRYYGTDLDFLRLEKKSKHGSVSKKTQARLTLDQVQKILAKDIAWMQESKDALLVKFYTLLRFEGLNPASITRYDRTAYTFEAGNVRVTIDRNLHISQDPHHFLHPNHPLIPAGDLAILEVKYDEYLPDIVRLLVGLENRRASAYSKYAASRRFG